MRTQRLRVKELKAITRKIHNKNKPKKMSGYMVMPDGSLQSIQTKGLRWAKSNPSVLEDFKRAMLEIAENQERRIWEEIGKIYGS